MVEGLAQQRAATARPVRLAVALAVAGGLTLTACAQTTDGTPGAAPPAATPSTGGAAAPSTGGAAAPSTGGAATPGSPTTTPDGTATTTPSATPAPATTSPEAPADPAEPASLRLGDEGPAVSALQQRLAELGYWHGESDGTYGQLTRQAVMAFQKAEGLTRDGITGPQTLQHLPDASRPTPRDTSGDHLEVDLERQILHVVRDGRIQWTFNTSTGSGEAYDRPSGGTGVAKTPRGEFAIQRQINGLRRAELGNLYRPKYFRGGIAVHGSGSIPAHPASHGCVRVTNSAMDLLWSSGVAEIGTPVIVY